MLICCVFLYLENVYLVIEEIDKSFSRLSLQVKDLFKELKVECNVVELDLIGKMEMFGSVCSRSAVLYAMSYSVMCQERQVGDAVCLERQANT